MGAVGEDRTAGVLARVHRGVGGPLKQRQIRRAEDVGAGGADRRGDVDQGDVVCPLSPVDAQ